MEGNPNMFKRENFGELNMFLLKCEIRMFVCFSGIGKLVAKIHGLLCLTILSIFLLLMAEILHQLIW